MPDTVQASEFSVTIGALPDRKLQTFSGRNGDLTATAIVPLGGSLAAAMTPWAEQVAPTARDLQPHARTAALLTAARAANGPLAALALEQGQARDEARAIAVARVRMLQPPPGREARHVQLHADRAKGLAVGEGHRLAATADIDTAAALLDAGQALTGLDDDAWHALEDRAALLFHAAKVGLAADHAKRPTVDDPFAIGPDQSAVEAAAAEAMARHGERVQALSDRRIHFQSVLAFLAVMVEASPSSVLAEAMSA